MRKRVIVPLSIVALLGIGGAVAWRLLRLSDLIEIGVGYSASLTCSCLFVSHRPLASCRADLDKLAQKLIKIEPGDNTVTARSLGLAQVTARFDDPVGCTLVR
jgi:hypothetical protein